MTKKILTSICTASILLSLFLTACVKTDGKETAVNEKRIDEGVDTKCQVTFSPYNGGHGDMFLSQGDKVAVIAPSSRPGKEQIEATINGLKDWGFIPVEGRHIHDQVYTIKEIQDDLKWALEDKDTKAIFSIRGGYGASEVMDEMPLELIKESKKLIIGYSDITVYHSAWSCLDLPSIHSCMSATFDGLNKESVDAIKAILQGSIPEYKCESNKYCKKGSARGILIGGNLSTFCSVLGTDYDITKTDEPYIIFLEDVGEDLQHIHRYLTILKHSGFFDRAAGIIFGEWTDMPSDFGDYLGISRGGAYESIADMISRQFL
ncbi:MAG: LD-carboxypeptidase, partial [Treponema sp.]|nr:LD-carboxypeptidase [Treponema sp.]